MDPHDYTDTTAAKNNSSSESLLQKPESIAKMQKIENKLKRLADLGDINTSKQTQIYMDALGELAVINPQMGPILKLVQSGMSASFQSAANLSFEKNKTQSDPTEGITDKDAQVKIKNYERVIKELKKQLGCYK